MSVHSRDSNPGADGEDDAEQDRHAPKLGKVPLHGRLAVGSVVIGNSQSGNVGKDGDEDDQLNVQAPVKNGNPQAEIDLEVDRQSDTVDDIGVHAVENLTRSLQGINDGTKTRGEEDDISSRASSIGSTLDSNTSIGLLERGSIVDTVTSHGNQVATLLQNLDDVVLVLGEHLGETISSLDEVVDLRARHVTATAETQTLSVVNVGTETKLAGSLTSNADGITSKHLDGQTERLGLVDGTGSVVARRVEAGHDTQDLPLALPTLAGNTQRTEATRSELGHLVLVGLVNLLRDGVILLDSFENEERRTLHADDALTLRGLDDGNDLLGDRVEGVELDDLVLVEDALGAGVVLQRLEESLVDGIKTLLLAGSGQAGSEHEVLGVNAGDGIGLVERELVLGEGTSLVRAEDLNTSQRFDGRELLDDGLLLGEVGSTDGHGGGDDGRETDRDTDDGNGESELEDHDNRVRTVKAGNPDDQEGQNDKDQQDGADAVEHLREVTAAGAGGADEGSSTANEGVVTSGCDDEESFTTLDSRRGVALVTLALLNGERLARDGRLVDLEESTIGDDATISGDDGTLLNLEDITGDDFGCLNLFESAITQNDSLQGQSSSNRISS